MPVATADTSFSELLYVEESTIGTTPASALTKLRFTGESLNFSSDTTESQEIRSDRLVPDLIRTATSTSGDINVEMSYGAFDDLIEGAFYSSWSAAVNPLTLEIDVTNATGVKPFTATLTDAVNSPFATLSVGQWIKVGGSDLAANDGYMRVDTVTADAITVTGESAFTNDIDGGGVGTVSSEGYMGVGTTRKSFTFEKQLVAGTGASPTDHIAYKGSVISEMEINAATGSVLTARFGTTGLSADAQAGTFGTGAELDAPTATIMNSIDSIGVVLEGGEDTSTVLEVQSLSFTLNNNTRAKQGIGSVSAFDIGSGRASITGSMSVYFTSRTFFEKFLDFDTSSISFRLTDVAGNSYIIDMPRILYSAAPVEITSIDQDVMVTTEFTATLDPTTGNSLSISRIDA